MLGAQRVVITLVLEEPKWKYVATFYITKNDVSLSQSLLWKSKYLLCDSFTDEKTDGLAEKIVCMSG